MGGETVTELARVVIGADGRNSLVADAVDAQEYNEKPRLQVSYYSYWSGLPMAAASRPRSARVWVTRRGPRTTT